LRRSTKSLTLAKAKIMTRQAIIEKTLKAINQLPENKAEEISDFAVFVMKRFEESRLTEAIQIMASKSDSFSFLNNDEDLYSAEDIKVKFND
jgi:hypothetical protein